MEPFCVDEAVGVAAKDALLGWHRWVHRRVESIHLLPGERGTRRVSLDCTPPPDPGLAYIAIDRGAASVSGVTGPMQVPLTLVEKGAMRDLDVVDPESRPMPVLGRRENGAFATAALLALFRSDLDLEPRPALTETLARIVHGDRQGAVRLAEHLLDRGRCIDGTEVDLRCISDLTALWTRDLAANFLLVGLIPARRAGQRQVLKWSANWHLEAGSMKGGRRIAIAAGYDVAEIGLPISGASATASYHLEVHLPAELAAARLELPSELANEQSAAVDESGNPVAHVHAEVDEVPDQQEAIVHVAVPWSGLRIVTATAAGLTALVFALGTFLPGAREALRSSSDGAAALLLVAPALMIAFSSRARESVAVSSLLAPLRLVTASCALLLVAGAASIVGGLVRPWYDALWWTGILAPGAVAVLLLRAPRALSDLRARLRHDKIWMQGREEMTHGKHGQEAAAGA